MEELYVVIPDEHLVVVDFQQDDMPGVGALNRALVDFEPKRAFPWHLSIWMELIDLMDHGMPTQAQRDLIDPFGELLEAKFKGPNESKPNALFLGRITWNASRELIYRVHDPEPVDATLRTIITAQEWPCDFDYRMDDDPDWTKAKWHLAAARPNESVQPEEDSRRS